MAYVFKCLADDNNRYLKSFRLFLERSSEHQCMLDFIHGVLPDILASIGGGRSSLNILGVGSGAGEIDLQMLSQLQLKHPGLKVDNEVVEPSDEMLYNYKVLVSKTPNLEHVNFKWNKMTASEFENHWQEKNLTKKMDFIHMIEMLYFVADPHATVSFFRSLLNDNGKLIIILASDKSGWGKLWKMYKADLCKGDTSYCVTTGDFKSFLDADGIKYKTYLLPSQMDITECFREGDERGELLLDFLTGLVDFTRSAPPDLRAGVMDLLRHPDCSAEADGKIVFNNTLEVLVLDA
ncbi:histamine N-methyltransferase-like [Conger conger]|uniref:histamine N-methyltransferase-like n=1 Tax=Conger conger TaxID=82655 RepID=UPI002A5A5BD4|nr:histamine N-methyltransferase-like [Conger conger]